MLWVDNKNIYTELCFFSSSPPWFVYFVIFSIHSCVVVVVVFWMFVHVCDGQRKWSISYQKVKRGKNISDGSYKNIVLFFLFSSSSFSNCIECVWFSNTKKSIGIYISNNILARMYIAKVKCSDIVIVK